MMWQRLWLFVALGLIVGVPFLLRPAASRREADLPRLIIVSPHVQQIRDEFAVAFDRWHRRVHGTGVEIDWRTPGGTSEIIKQLEAQFTAAIKNGQIGEDGSCAPGTIGFDLMFGGGSFDHGRLKSGVTVRVGAGEAARDVKMSMSVPAGFGQEELDRWFGENAIGAQTLYDPDQYWIGTALSSFGIVYNKDVFRELGLPEPRTFEDLCRPELAGWIALADPRQSGSITTTFDSILSNYGWDRGWRILREMSANTRYFTNSSTKPPIDVSQGDAAAGLAIDFYGRGQAQFVTEPGQDPAEARVGYVDPEGTVYVDADPVSLLRGGPSPELAKRFVVFCLTDEAQALWQFPPRRDPRSVGNPVGSDGEPMGPEVHALRRMPVRREIYARFGESMLDRVDPFAIASRVKPAGWRSAIGPMMGAFGIESAHEQRAAWAAIRAARADAGFPAETLAEMERLFASWPTTEVDGKALEFTQENYRAIREAWRAPGAMSRYETSYTRFFMETYRMVVDLGRSAGR